MSVRRTFRYPADDDDAPEAIDEQEQQEVIDKLSAQDTRSSLRFQAAFLTIPVVSLLYYIARAFLSGDIVLFPLFYIACLISSCLSVAVIDDVGQRRSSGVKHLLSYWTSHMSHELMRKYDSIRYYAIWLNTALSLFLVLWPWIAYSPEESGSAVQPPDLWNTAPAIVVFLVACLARHELKPVDTMQLQNMKYDYKGA